MSACVVELLRRYACCFLWPNGKHGAQYKVELTRNWPLATRVLARFCLQSCYEAGVERNLFKYQIVGRRRLIRRLNIDRERKMGQTLSEPITKKKSACCRDSNYRVGSSCMQGWRVKMEDSHVHILSLPSDPGTAFFAVYDGHGGATMALHAGKHLHEYVTKRSEYKEGDIVRGIQEGFLELDNAMQNNPALRDEHAGTTVIALLIKDNILYSANAGDSRAVACINGRTVPLSRDHKPTLKDERKRIEAAGGFVEYKRVNGNLALSRALGDFIFKRNDHKPPQEQIVTAFPEIQQFTVDEEWEFVVLACDGIWDVMTSEEVVNFVRTRLAQTKLGDEESHQNITIHPEEICEELLNCCLAPDALMGTGCDNMTVILVCFLHGKPCSQLVLRCQNPPPSIDL